VNDAARDLEGKMLNSLAKRLVAECDLPEAEAFDAIADHFDLAEEWVLNGRPGAPKPAGILTMGQAER